MLSVYTAELLSAVKIITFLLQEFKTGKSERKSNKTPYPELEYLSGSEILANLTAPNRKFFRVKTY